MRISDWSSDVCSSDLEGHNLEWQLLARQLEAAGRIQVGEYPLEPGTTPRDLLVRMRDGKVLSYRFTIVEGWNIRQLRAALATARPLRQETADLDYATLMEALGHPGQHPQGRFLPETTTKPRRRRHHPTPRTHGKQASR